MSEDLTRSRAAAVAAIRRCMAGEFYRQFSDPQTQEIDINADLSMWVDKPEGRECCGQVAARDSLYIIKMVASCLGQTLDKQPFVEGEFPLDGSRFEGIVPPLVANPVIALRKKATRVFTLEDYVREGILSRRQHQVLCAQIMARRNLLVAGATATGKTTFVNALIAKLVELCPDDRLALIEDTVELQCTARNFVQLRTAEGVGMDSLLQRSLRLSPQRIVVGEVRGPEALDLIMAWNTGHSGGCGTIHADSATDALNRVMILCSGNERCPRLGLEQVISRAINCVVFIARHDGQRRIEEVLEVVPIARGGDFAFRAI